MREHSWRGIGLQVHLAAYIYIYAAIYIYISSVIGSIKVKSRVASVYSEHMYNIRRPARQPASIWPAESSQGGGCLYGPSAKLQEGLTRQGPYDVRTPCTVPYEGDNFANSKMDNFSLIFKTS